MGYPMAVNLIKGLGASKSFLIADVNQEALRDFQDEVKGFGKVSVVQNGYEATKAAVRFCAQFAYREANKLRTLLLLCYRQLPQLRPSTWTPTPAS